jgi:hypothetical protein
MPPIGVERRQIRGIPCVGQKIEIHDRRTRGIDPVQDEIRADKPCAPGHQNRVTYVAHSNRVYGTKQAQWDNSGASSA